MSDLTFEEKARRVVAYLCLKCIHEKCNTSSCPVEHLTGDDIITRYNDIWGEMPK